MDIHLWGCTLKEPLFELLFPRLYPSADNQSKLRGNPAWEGNPTTQLFNMHCTALYSIVLQCSVLQCTAVQCTAVQCSAVQCTALHCNFI